MTMSTDNPQTKLTDWITQGKTEPGEKTRVLSREQLEYYYAYSILGEEFDFFKRFAEIDMRLMISFKGKSREEIIQALVGMTDEESEDVGIRPVREHFRRVKMQKHGDTP
jgi:hypothetical protein